MCKWCQYIDWKWLLFGMRGYVTLIVNVALIQWQVTYPYFFMYKHKNEVKEAEKNASSLQPDQ